MRPVCLVIGAGAGIGGTVGKRFAQEGYHSVLCRRSDEAGLNKLVSQINERGGEASGFLLNAVDEGSIEECIAEVESQIGPIEVVVFNLGAQVGNRSLQDTSYKVFELGWKMATFALFRTASTLFPLMEKRGKRYTIGHFIHCSCSWQCPTAFACCGYGWATYALPVLKCRICQ